MMNTPTAQILLAHFSYAAMASSEADAEDASKFWILANTFFSAAFAGTVAVAVTAAIEKWGGTVGGIIGSLPSTIVPMSVGVALQVRDPEAVIQSLFNVPTAMITSFSFLYMWRIIPPWLPNIQFYKRLIIMVVVSLMVWASGSVTFFYVIRGLKAAGISVTVIGPISLASSAVFGLVAAFYKPVPSPKGNRKVAPLTYLARSLLAATSIGTGVFLSKWSQVLSVFISSFPAIFLTTMVSLWLSQGEAVPSGAIGPLLLGSVSTGVFALLFALLFGPFQEHLGLGLGIVCTLAVAWTISALTVSIPVFFGLRWRNRSMYNVIEISEDEESEESREMNSKESDESTPLFEKL